MRHQLTKQPHCNWPSCGKFVIDEPPHLCKQHGELLHGFIAGLQAVKLFHELVRNPDQLLPYCRDCEMPELNCCCG